MATDEETLAKMVGLVEKNKDNPYLMTAMVGMLDPAKMGPKSRAYYNNLIRQVEI